MHGLKDAKGYEGLKPNHGGGRPPKLTEEQKEELKEILKEKDSWTTKEVQELIKAEFGVIYSSSQLRRILKSFGMRYARPYQKDYRRPDNAEDTFIELRRIKGTITTPVRHIGRMSAAMTSAYASSPVVTA